MTFLPKWVLAVDWNGTVTGVDVSNSTVNIKLTEDTNLDGFIIVRSGGTVNLDLNGCILKRINANERVAILVDGGVLNITDSSPSVAHAGSLTTVGSFTKIWQPSGSGVTLYGGIITGGRYGTDSGGCIQVNGTSKLKLQGGTLAGNVCSAHDGGAVALFDNATFEMTGGKICYNGAASGGGVMAYWTSTTFSMSGGEISYNVATGSGGGVRAEGTSFTMTGGAISNNVANAGNGGGVYCNASTIAVKKGDFIGNEAGYNSSTDQGGDGGAFEIAAGRHGVFGATGAVNIKTNKARIGGGICAEGNASITLYGTVTIQNNTATLSGGGIQGGSSYAGSDTHVINIYGVTITGNTVSAGGSGGGLNSGYARVRIVGTSDINVYNNKVGSTPCDIYLFPAPDYNPSGSSYYPRDRIEVAVNGIKPVNVGIDRRVLQSGNDQRFFYSTTASYLTNVYNGIKNGTYKVFSNKPQFSIVKAYSSGNYIYFTNPWSSTQQGISTSTESLVGGVYQIGTVQQLTAFLCRVNGIRTNTVDFGTGDLSANGKLTADINMSGHYWVPIANGYKGIFDGNGYSISGLTLAADHPSSERGMFGQLAAGCEVKNLQLHSCNYSTSKETWMGCIASRILGGTIHDCVVDGTLAGNNTATYIGGLVGSAGNVDIHSCCAMATLSGGTRMGGLVGSLSDGRVKNCFANPTLTTGAYAGGLVGYSTGTVDNCYMRGSTSFAGTEVPGSITHCYGPSGTSTSGSNGVYSATVTPYKYRHADNQVKVGTTTKSLLQWLNDGRASGHTAWMRTCGSPINGDYPILVFPNSVCVGSTSSDGKILEYSNNFYTKFGNYIASNTGTIYLFKTPSETVTYSNSGKNTKLYIQEDVALIHTSVITNAYVGVTLKNAAWHMFSPALSNAPLGINYNGDATVYPYGTAPAQYAFYPESTYDGYFPSTDFGGSAYYSDYDYYCYYEPEYHWINFKRNTPSHWHEDLAPGHPNIEYHWDNNPGNALSLGNETSLKPGKGYLLGINTDTYLQSHGTLNPSNGTGDVTFSVSRKSGWRTGYNLIGNPYQAYLDFNLFADANSGSGKIWSNASSAFYLMIYDGAYHQHVYNASTNELQAPRCLHPHQGFMVITANDNINATFTNTMRVKSNATNAPFRDEPQIDYPLVNLIATDDEGKSDIMTVELGRPEVGGAPKIYDLHLGKGCLYVNYEDQDYAIAFTQPGVSEVGVRFAADEEATFTMTWDMENGDFSYVHLIDNMTGVDTDCLQDSTYCFTARPSDYKSRFRLVFDYTGIEEPETPEPVEGPTHFAFQMGNELVVNGEGQLQMFDLAGRQVLTTNISGTQSRVALPELGTGIYVLRMNGKNEVITQKIVIE